MTHRFFKAPAAVYEAMRVQIDAAWGYPEPLTLTSIPPANVQHKHADGDCIMGVRLDWLGWEPVATLIPQALASGMITEMTEAEYWAQMPQMPSESP